MKDDEVGSEVCVPIGYIWKGKDQTAPLEIGGRAAKYYLNLLYVASV